MHHNNGRSPLDVLFVELAPSEQAFLGEEGVVHVYDGHSSVAMTTRVLVGPLSAECFHAFIAPTTIRQMCSFVLADLSYTRHVWY